MKRKFSFDIPKLKFGPSKQDVQALKQHLAASKSFEYSEPPTPKSVRPPLPSHTEAELKAACAWIIVNYRPSHIPYERPVGVGVSVQNAQHVDYAAINAAVRREMEGGAPAAVQWPSIPSEEVRVEQNGGQWPSSDMFRYKPTETSEDLFQHDELEAMREQRNSIMTKADELMANLEETQKVLLTPEIRAHSRTASSQSALSLPYQESDQLHKATLRADSVGTVTSTPRTDITSSGWADSTAPTSAHVTPAPQSKRTSHTQLDTHLPPKVTAVDAEWMRLELERHLKAQEEELARGDSPVQDAAAVLAETTPTQVAHTPASPQSIRRKPLPRRATGESQQNFSLPADSRQSKPHSRTESRFDSMPTSPVNRHTFQRPSTGDRAAASESKRASRARSITGDAQNQVRPSTAQTTVKMDAGMSDPRSRAQSMKSGVQNFSRPSLDAASRKVSLDISRPQSRGRSVDSFRSAVSAVSSTAGSSAKAWRNSMARRRSQDSDKSVGVYSVRTPESTRGRPRMPRHSPPPPPPPQINLNRELPALPGLDQWRPLEVKTGSPEPTALVVEDEAESDRHEDVKPQQGSFPRRKDSLVNRKPSSSGNRHPAATTPTAPHLYARQSVYLDAEQYYDQALAPTNTRTNTQDPAASPGLPSADFRKRHSRIRSVTSPDITNQMSQVSLGQVSTEQRPSTRQLNSAPQIPIDKRHSRIPSGSAEAPNFSRKLSSDDYSRMYDRQYQNMLEVTPSYGSGSSGGNSTPGLPSKEKRKSRWWQSKSKMKREETWMDAVVKSGSRSGVLLTDEVAGAPIVRY